MPKPPLSATVAWIGRVALSPGPDTSDGVLLARFVRSGDQPAFRELVRRLGPMVLGVCRRLTADAHLAEDAFQAVFLVLARRAADVRPREAVRGWLYGVAVRTAQKARVMSARRRAREVPCAEPPDGPAPACPEPDADALRALDEEVAALPEHLRAAVVLCELGGTSRKAAASRLSIPEGTLSSRLGKARKVLADHLRQRGVAPALAGLCGVLARSAPAAVPPQLLGAAAALADGSMPASASVSLLYQGVLRTMYLTKLKMAVLGGLLLAVAVWAVRSTSGAGAVPACDSAPALLTAAAPADEEKPQPSEKPAPGATLLLARPGGLVPLSPEGKEGAELTAPDGTETGFTGRLSPDGSRAAFLVSEGGPRPVGTEPIESWPFKVVVRKLGAKEPSAVVEMPAQQVNLCWSPDGKRLLVSKLLGAWPGTGTENVLLDPDSGKTEPLELPAGVRVLDWSRDGKTFLVVQRDDKKYRLGLASRGDKEMRELTELNGRIFRHVGRLSPDGKRVLYTDADPEEKDAYKWGVSSKPYLLDVATKKRELLAEFPQNAQVMGVAWSPDGKRIAYTWKQHHPDLLKKDQLDANEVQLETEAFLIVADADGKNARTVSSAKISNAINMIFGTVDWR
jgi:RNA polymerase sigma factor (sigma-70 family)